MLTIRQALTSLYIPNRPQLSPRTIGRYQDEVTRWERLMTAKKTGITQVFPPMRKFRGKQQKSKRKAS